MPLFKVTETRTTTLTHLIKADDKPDALAHMQYRDTSRGQMLIDVLEDDFETEYEVELSKK